MDTNQFSVQYMKLSLLILTINFFFLLFQQTTRYLGISQRCRLGTDGKKTFHTAIITRKIKYNVKICNSGALLLLKEINASIIKNCHDQGALLTFFILTFILFQGELDYEIQPNDRIVFISTLHGGWCLQYWNNSLEKSRSCQFQICLESFCTEIKIFSPLGVLLSKQEVQKRNITFLYEWYCLSFFYNFDNNSKMSFIHACKIE